VKREGNIEHHAMQLLLWFLGVIDPQHARMGFVGTWEIQHDCKGMPLTWKDSNKRVR